MVGSSNEDVLFAVRNALHLGAPQTAISEATHLTGLSDDEKHMRDVLTHRAYIELGSSEVRDVQPWRVDRLINIVTCGLPEVI